MPESIVRNDITKELKTYKIVKGVNKDKEYLAPDVSDPQEWEQNQKWVGLPHVINCVQTFLKRTFQELWFDNIGDDGVHNMAKFLTEAADFTAAGMKLKEIKDKLEELQAQQGQLIAKLEPDSTGGFPASAMAAIKELNESILVLKAMAEARSRKKAETEAEPAVAVA